MIIGTSVGTFCRHHLFILILFLHIIQSQQQQIPRITFISQSQLVPENDTTTLECQATGTEPMQVCFVNAHLLHVQYQWWKSDTPLSQLSLSRTYTISRITRNQAGVYRCLVRNTFGAMFSDYTNVIVSYIDNFDSNTQRTQYRFVATIQC
jgi:hypothetical protein